MHYIAGLFYFNMKNRWLKHSYSERNEERILEVRARYGLAGYGLLWMLRESLAENDGKISMSRLSGLAVTIGTDTKTVKEFIELCCEVELFYVDNEGYFHCKNIEEHITVVAETSAKAKEAVAKRWENLRNNAENTVVLQPNYDGNTDKIREDKRREENTTAKRKSSRSAKSEFSEEVYSLYEAYPLKQGKPDALTAIDKAITYLKKNPSVISNYFADKNISAENLEKYSEPITFLRTMIKKYVKSKPDWQAYAQPATWFNKQRYLDEIQKQEQQPKVDLGFHKYD